MLNFNGVIYSTNDSVTLNRASNYGDALFDTLKFKDGKFHFLEDHYLRLLASMRQLRMEIPKVFTLDYFKSLLSSTVTASSYKDAANVKTIVWRDGKGKYTPETLEVNYVIEATPLYEDVKSDYTLGVFKEYMVNTNSIDNLKTTNRLINILGGIYAKENEFDNCLLLNYKKAVASVLNANLFAVKEETLITPPLSDGALNGVIRKQILSKLASQLNIKLEERSLSISDLMSCDEVFITNSIVEVQPITKLRRKTFQTNISNTIKSLLLSNVVEITN